MTAQATVMDRTADRRRGEWRRHRMFSWAIRALVVAGPILLSLLVSLELSSTLPRITDVGTAILWIVVIVAVTVASLILFERAARRLLPLAALLDISLVFPDRAPARFRVARRTGRQRDLQGRLREAVAAGHLDEATRLSTVIELVLALSVHDRATRGHSERVRVFTDMVAQEMKVSAAGRERLRWAAMLHDIGKLEVPATTLNKKGQLDHHEWVALHRHPKEGAHLVAPLLSWLAEWGAAVEQHHERYDGTGYPHGLRGDEISLAARIVALADSYEVMTAPRSYKRPMGVRAAREEIVRVAGTQLDPTVVRAFLNISIGRLWRAVGVGAWIAQLPLAARLVGSFSTAGAQTIAGATAVTALVLGGIAGPSSTRAFATAPVPTLQAALSLPHELPPGSSSSGGEDGISSIQTPLTSFDPPPGAPGADSARSASGAAAGGGEVATQGSAASHPAAPAAMTGALATATTTGALTHGNAVSACEPAGRDDCSKDGAPGGHDPDLP